MEITEIAAFLIIYFPHEMHAARCTLQQLSLDHFFLINGDQWYSLGNDFTRPPACLPAYSLVRAILFLFTPYFISLDSISILNKTHVIDGEVECWMRRRARAISRWKYIRMKDIFGQKIQSENSLAWHQPDSSLHVGSARLVSARLGLAWSGKLIHPSTRLVFSPWLS